MVSFLSCPVPAKGETVHSVRGSTVIDIRNRSAADGRAMTTERLSQICYHKNANVKPLPDLHIGDKAEVISSLRAGPSPAVGG